MTKKHFKLDGKTEKTPIWTTHVTYRYQQLHHLLTHFGKQFGIAEEPEPSEPQSPPKRKYTRKAPKVPSKHFEAGYTMTSENDGNLYQVVLNKHGHKRWKKCKS